MRVFHILNQLSYSGAERMISSAYPEWAKVNIKVSVLENSPTSGKYGKSFNSIGIEVFFFEMQKVNPLIFIFKLSQFLRRQRPNIVHSHSQKLSWMVAVACRMNQIKHVHTIHHIFEFEGILKFRTRLERKLMAKLGTCQVTNSLGNQCNEVFRFKNSTIRVDNWSGFAQEFRNNRESKYVKNKQPCMLLIGKCEEYKNHTFAIDVLTRLKSKYPECLLIHVGESGITRTAEIEKIKEYGLESNILFLEGDIDWLEISRRVDLFIHPSTREGFGIAILDALDLGIPGIISSMPNHGSIFLGQEFIEVCSLEIDAFVQKIVLCFQNRDLNIEVNSGSHFSPQRGASEYAYIYENLC